MKAGATTEPFEGYPVYDRLMAILLGSGNPQDLEDLVHPGFTGFGSAAHEIFESPADVIEMARKQMEQFGNQHIQVQRYPPLARRITPDTCHIVEAFHMSIGGDHSFALRVSTVLCRVGDRWWVTHLHGSTPDTNISEEEAFPVEGLRKKNLELEAKIRERTRDLEIEAAMERVRTRSMAMQSSEDLKEVIRVIFEQLTLLNVNAEHAGIVVDYSPGQDWHFWVADNQDIPSKITVPYLDLPWDRQFTAARKNGAEFFTTHLDFEEKNSFYQKLLPHIPGVTAEACDFYLSCPGLAASTVLQEDIALYVENFSGSPYSEEDNNILRRFGKVFQQAYTRFQDLQKAETQAREAQVEAALERVRSSMMAMHKTEDLHQVLNTVMAQLQGLGFPAEAAAIIIIDEELTMEHWMTGYSGDYPESYKVPYSDHPYFTGLLHGWQKGDSFREFFYEGDAKIEFSTWCLENSDFRRMPPEFKKEMLNPARIVVSETYNRYGMLEVISQESLAENAIATLKRFSKVFEQAYTRFLDLKKAEAQAREAQVEAALERVRSRSMAMHKSEELAEVATVLYNELIKLEFSAFSYASIVIFDEPNNQQIVWGAQTESEFLEKSIMPLLGDQILQELYDNWHSGESFFTVKVGGKALKNHNDFVFPVADRTALEDRVLKNMPDPTFFHCAVFSMGYIELVADRELPEESASLLKRFAKVFEQTYTRFLDLQKAEAQAKEARVEAALERVRARTMGMQSSDELREVVLVINQELHRLGFGSNACNIIILDKETGDSTYWVSGFTKDIYPVSFHVPHLDHPYYEMLLLPWKQGEQYTVYEYSGRDKKDFDKLSFAKTGFKNVPAEAKKAMEDLSHVVLSTAYFSNGALQVLGSEALPGENAAILQRFAKVFDQTYTRFLDLQLKEQQAMALNAEKQRLEKTLEDLRATQTQLIHSEKMASLGELTAGIAHEIQNPLNFVNNFSEVSRELLQELLEELNKGDKEEVDAIAHDVIQNLEKIVHHGRRADSIVKGMLQHSRSGDGHKQPTDLNRLADEYLRLAYHGLRAKDKSFNATMVTDFDPTLGKVKVVPQDIGRVLLNLLTNAFHAVQERTKQGEKGYVPTVTVRTKKEGGRVRLEVADNGNGIPDSIKEKIFQPFFTTKPTGQGTGLGLSMSYDIVTKGHGGELTVRSKEGEGTEFCINFSG